LDPPDATGFPLDVMLVPPETFQKLYLERVEGAVGNAQLNLPKPLHLIALKLHAMRNPARFGQGKDLLDILNLISLCEIDTESPEFLSILDRHANDETRELLLRSIC
jgi:hypothetical protein